MKIQNQNGTLNVELDPTLDAFNENEVKKQITSVLDSDCDIKRIILDAAHLEYISSAGLRVILFLKVNYKQPVSFINVAKEVYDVLDITGFTKIIGIPRNDELQS